MKIVSIKTILMGAMALSALSTGIVNAAENTSAYVVDTRGVVVKSGTGLCWRTGYWTPATAIAECDPDLFKKPAVVAEAPAPAAPAPVVPPKTAPDKITFSSDALFDFDKATLRPEGKKAMDDFVGKLQGLKYEVITATGHADRIGGDAYNQKLSEKRAESVKTYLVKSKGIAAQQVFTTGKGETMPVTKKDQCKGEGRDKALIACLQPDRRVVIEVAGTRSK